MMRRIWRFLRGYAVVRCEGGLHNRFFNMALTRGLHPFLIRVRGYAARFCIPIAEYRALRPIARKSQCRIRVVRKRGLYFLLHRIPNKAALSAGLAAFCAVMILLGNTVVTIEVQGSSTIPREEVLASLERGGLRVGMLRGEVDVGAVTAQILMDNDRLSWAAVNLSFGKAVIEVKDAEPAPSYETMGISVVATRDAQVQSIIVISGQALVKPGQTVRKGETLAGPASGTVPGSWTQGVSAEVMGYTMYSVNFTLGRHHIFRDATGQVRRQLTLRLGDHEIPLPFFGNPFRYYEVYDYERPAELFSVRLPVTVVTREYAEMSQTAETLTPERAAALFEESCAAYERAEMAHCEVLNREISVEETPDGYRCRVVFFCLENIGETLYEMP